MKIFRFEGADGNGIHWSKDIDGSYLYSFLTLSMTDELNSIHRELPTPHVDKRLVYVFKSNLHFCGVYNYEQFDMWFRHGWLDELFRVGFFGVLYEIDDNKVHTSNYQVIFDKKDATSKTIIDNVRDLLSYLDSKTLFTTVEYDLSCGEEISL